ncbi:MAG: hypothetical protein M3177_01630 [Pseudomonadota bacterium]|nr:hypothetical protein [Pseudomonadota bacterium]
MRPDIRPDLHPRLVNGRFGDPGLFVEMLHRRAALLFDVRDVSALSPRDLLRVTTLFFTHTHMDRFIGFAALLRVCVGRDKRSQLVGPRGFADRVEHKLLAYEMNRRPGPPPLQPTAALLVSPPQDSREAE